MLWSVCRLPFIWPQTAASSDIFPPFGKELHLLSLIVPGIKDGKGMRVMKK